MTETWQDDGYSVVYYQYNSVSTLVFTGLRDNFGKRWFVQHAQQAAAVGLLRSGVLPSAVIHDAKVAKGVREV